MKKLHISQVDGLFADGIYPIEFLFYYKEGLQTTQIRAALRKLSSVFWPVFGEYKDGIISFVTYHEEDCFDEEAVNQQLNIREIEKGGLEVLSRFCLPDIKRLFFLKAIRFKNGMALIPKMNHLAGDGYSYFYFLSRLAALSRPVSVSFKHLWTNLFYKPHHRRTALKDFSFRGVRQKAVLADERLAVEFDEILRRDVKSIIREALSIDRLRISSNDVLSAMAIKKMVGRPGGLRSEDVNLTMPIDVRRYIKEYGPRFLGNGLMMHTLKLRREQIDHSSLKEIAAQIRESMPILSKETYLRYLTALEQDLAEGNLGKFRPFDPERGCLVTNLSKLPADQLDFGAGCPELIIPLTVEKNSAAILAKKENYILRLAF